MNEFDFDKYILQFSSDKNYDKSEENLIACKPYSDICKYISAFIKDNISSVEKDFQSIKTDKIEYAKNCKNIHRGFYCPSPIYDIVVTNSRRGNIKRNGIFDSFVNYAYHFDKEGKIFLIEEFSDGKNLSDEKIFYKENVSYGFKITAENVEAFTECKYIGNLISSYTFAIINPIDYSVISLETEKYKYNSANLICEADCYFFCPSDTLTHSKYYFNHDEKGIINSYRVENYVKGNRVKIIKNDDLLLINIPKYKMRKI